MISIANPPPARMLSGLVSHKTVAENDKEVVIL